MCSHSYCKVSPHHRVVPDINNKLHIRQAVNNVKNEMFHSFASMEIILLSIVDNKTMQWGLPRNSKYSNIACFDVQIKRGRSS